MPELNRSKRQAGNAIASTVAVVSIPMQARRCTKCQWPLPVAVGDAATHPTCDPVLVAIKATAARKVLRTIKRSP